MDELLEQLVADPWGRLVFHLVVSGGLWSAYVFLLVAARFAGMFLVAPLFMTITIPCLVRVSLVVLLSLVIAPTLSLMDVEGNNVTFVGHASTNHSMKFALPATVIELGCGIAGEVGLGTVFGAGMIAIFSGLRLGGEWFDRHSGLGLGTVFNPEWSAGQSTCGSLAQLLGIAGLLLAEPIGGHWQLLHSVVQSFHAIPVGTVSWSFVTVELLNGVVQQCLILGIRVALPLVVAMMLVDVTLTFASRGATPAENSAYLAIRMAVGIMVLALTTTTIPESVAQGLLAAVQLVEEVHLQ